jgi:hypothetical protein
MGGYLSMDAYIKRSLDQGATWQDKTYFGVHHTYGDGGGDRWRVADLKTFFGNYQDVIALVVRSYNNEGREAPHLISSLDDGNTFTLIKSFVWWTADTQAVRFLERHPFNSSRLYCVGNSTDGYILASANRGASWVDKIGNWFTAFGAYPTNDAQNKYCTFHPVW